MAGLASERDGISELRSNEGLEFQTQLVRELFDEKGIKAEVDESRPIVGTVLTKTGNTFQEIGISQPTIDKLKKGDVCLLDKDDKTILLDLILFRIGADSVKQFHKGILTKKFSKVDIKNLETISKAVYEDTRVQIVGNVVQIFCSSVEGYVFFENFVTREVHTSLGLSFRFPKAGGRFDAAGIIINVIREDYVPRRDYSTRQHELWHAFDSLRFGLIGITNPYEDTKFSTVDTRKLFDQIYDYFQGKPKEFINFMFGRNWRYPTQYDLHINKIKLSKELPAFLAGYIRPDRNSEMEVEITNILVGAYLLNSHLDLKALRKVCDVNDEGKFIVNTKAILEGINPQVARINEEDANEKEFLEYFTEIEFGSFPKRRKFKDGMEEKARLLYQELVDLIYNDKASVLYQVYNELNKAMKAYLSRNSKVGPHRALVEMSILPFNRWKSYVRMKESEETN